MILQKEYQHRRRELAKRLPPDSVALIPAAKQLLRNGDACYRFRQDSDFYYLTGFNEPEGLLFIDAGGNACFLFIRGRDPAQEQWDGKRLAPDEACETLGVDAAYSLTSLNERLPELLAEKNSIYYPVGRYPAWEKTIFQAWQVVKGQNRRGVKAPDSFCDLAPIIAEMRLFKSKAEINVMRTAARISVAAHQRAMRACRKVDYEYQLEAELLYEFTRQGCRSVAYDSIVAGGSNACVLHYTENNNPLKRGELVLIDAGGEFENYASDVTRTFPVSGTFSAEQREVYTLVLSAQQAGIACVRPGCVWDEINQTIVRVLTSGLIDLGLLCGSLEALIGQEAYKPFYMHTSGHWLGLDVHDCGRYKVDKKWRSLESGMVLTVEPGLYISAGMSDVDSRWWNIGVRIEDDIRVTHDGYENLTASLAVEIDDVEALVRG